MFQQRLERLQAELRRRGIHCLVLVPGANLRYLTGIDFHLMERPTALFVPAQGEPIFTIPSLEVLRVQNAMSDGTLYEAQIHHYSDAEGPDQAFTNAMRALPEVQKYAVEYLRMRVMELNIVRRHLPVSSMEDAGPVMDTLRLTKDAAEVAAMRKAIQISEEAMSAVLARVRPGMTEQQITSMLNIAQIERGGGPVPFEPIVLIGPNTAQPHGTPTDAALKVGDPLLIDYGTSYDGYISDITRVFFYGRPPSDKQREIYETVKAANEAGRRAAGPGVPCQEVDRATRKVIDDAGYGQFFVHRTGHGIGMEGHEGPYIREGNDLLLEVGMTFTVEPGIYVPGEIGVRIEDNLVITEHGSESLTTFDRDVCVVGSSNE